MERDRFMSPIEAKDFGLLDTVLEHPPDPAQSTDANKTTWHG